ncbi:hypothetical protein PGT21_022769 [Puccinia graminis f. sp. tritici]|uniref:Uncharacterized protein n=1 Tax=Puccinia graminis f. sp. tritici TaxID=56615 RepID=A0A5B0QBH7_PUCGR|nr:hypothetical protein PGT21_022769 [Puccinia graminis f. sp. tritici]
MVALMEPDNLEGDESTERMSVTNCSYACQIEEAQNAISQRSMERNIPYYAVPDALVIWNIRRMRLDPIRIHGWKTEHERRLQMSTFNNQGN